MESPPYDGNVGYDDDDNGNDGDANKKVPSTSWSLLPMSSVEQTAEAQIQLSLPKVKS